MLQLLYTPVFGVGVVLLIGNEKAMKKAGRSMKLEKSFGSEGCRKLGKLGGQKVSMSKSERNDCSIHTCCPFFNHTTFH
jgi:hypothetical protein